jgi:hypothetical protein
MGKRQTWAAYNFSRKPQVLRSSRSIFEYDIKINFQEIGFQGALYVIFVIEGVVKEDE